jgi:nucleotide-binding universal stress UspA family protein
MTDGTTPSDPGGRVVAAFDGSPTSRAAVAWALSAAARGGTGLEW